MNEQNNTQPKRQILPVEFTGSGGEFFKIWIVNLFLTILTLGIYSAWAKVRTTRYFYGNTRLGDSGFEYLASPMAILKGRLIAVALLLIFVIAGEMFPFVKLGFILALFIATPWIVWRSIRFNARMSSYRNVRFGFYGSLQEAYKYLLLIPMLPILAAAVIGGVMWLLLDNINGETIINLMMFAFLVTYLLVPYIQKSITAYTINNHRYGQGQLSADLSARKYYLVYLALFGFSLLILIALGIVTALVATTAGVGPEIFQGFGDGAPPPASMGLIIGAMIIFYVLSILLGALFKAYIQAKIRNYVFNQTRLDDVLQLRSDMTVRRLFGFYLANILLMVFTLGLAYPWVMVRIARFSADATKAVVNGSLEQYATQQQGKQSALGEEMGEAFDVDVAVDLAF